MLLYKHYDEKEGVQEVWYDSSMIVYTRMTEDEHENKGDLYVTFKNGATYKYKDVTFGDYVLLLYGGTDVSQGKTMNKIIKPKYQYERQEDKDTGELIIRMQELFRKQEEEEKIVENTYFISGHRDITEREFEVNYMPLIYTTVDENKDARFVIGDYYGVDIMAQNYLVDVLGIDPERVTVYHMKEEPRNINPNITNKVGGFESDEERDAAMTRASGHDIAFVRDNTKLSGTGQNILRRYLLKL